MKDALGNQVKKGDLVFAVAGRYRSAYGTPAIALSNENATIGRREEIKEWVYDEEAGEDQYHTKTGEWREGHYEHRGWQISKARLTLGFKDRSVKIELEQIADLEEREFFRLEQEKLRADSN